MSVESRESGPVALVVEDDQDTIDLLDQVLTRAGFAVITADNGVDGVALAAEHHPALATVDINMPGIDGLETTRRIREVSHTYIVIISSRAQEADVLAGFEAGADDYVPKPIRPIELRARLGAVARRPMTPVEGGPSAPPRTWAAADPDAAHVALLDEVAANAEPDPDGVEGRDGMVELGMRFVGSWIEFHGLRINPSRAIVVVDDRLVDLTPEDLVLLETLLYCGTRTVGPRQLAQRVRQHSDDVHVPGNEQEGPWIESRVGSLRARLGDDGRWFEAVPPNRYRLARPH